MLLILSNSEDVTTDYLVDILCRRGVNLLRFDTDQSLSMAQFRYEIGAPALRIANRCYTPEQFTNVWYRRPERLKHKQLDESPEGKFALDEWSEALEAFFAHIPSSRWINHPSANVAASHKLQQLTTASQIGFSVPNTLVTNDADRVRRFFREHKGNIIAKPMSQGYVERGGSERDSLIYTNRVDEDQLGDLLDLASCPTLFQVCVEKQSDVRITVVDEDIHAVELRAIEPDGSQRCDVRRYNMADVAYQSIALPQQIGDKIRALTFHYGLRYAAIDMAVSTTGEWVFFEVNPNGQWAWLDLAGAAHIAESFVRILANP